MNKYVLISSFLFFQHFYHDSFSQSDYKSEEALIKIAQNFYASGKYAEAAPLFAQLLSNHPDDVSYHLYYGISLLYTSKNKAEAVRHLESAAGVEQEANYYLARAYHLNGQYEKAIARLRVILNNSKENKEMQQKADVLISVCRNAQGCDFNSLAEFILSREEITEDHVISLYNFENNSGRFLATPSKFIKGKSNKEKFSKYVFLSSSGNAIVFSGPGKSDFTELFISRKKSGNGWGDAEPVKFRTGLTGDKITPVISPGSDTIYFSWNGSKSFGGYDVFRSVYNPSARAWSEPENMGLPVNSVFDDFNYLPGIEGDIAYVSSSRGCDAGKIYVLKIDMSGLKSFSQNPEKNNLLPQSSNAAATKIEVSPK